MGTRRVLVISYYFPPLPSAGSLRMAGLAKYLPRFGWQATVVTPRLQDGVREGVRVVETGDADLAAAIKRWLGLRHDAALKDLVSGRRAATGSRQGLRGRLVDLGKALTVFPDTNRNWIPIAYSAACRVLESERHDVVLTTSPPPSAHFVGRRLKGSHDTRWVADFRDLWSDDINSTAPGWRRAIDRRIEVRCLQRADALVTVSQPLAEELGALHRPLPVHSILNGFDPDLLRRGTQPSREFVLTHTGTFYQGRRDPSLLFAAVRNLLDRGHIARQRVRIRLYVRHEPWVARLARTHGVEDVVELLPWSCREATVRAQQEAQILLLLHWDGEREAGVYTAKVFEYLAARRPILMVGGGSGVLSELLQETRAGVHVTELATLERQLLEWWQEFRAHGEVCWRGDDERIERYSQVRMAEEFASVLDSVCESQ